MAVSLCLDLHVSDDAPLLLVPFTLLVAISHHKMPRSDEYDSDDSTLVNERRRRQRRARYRSPSEDSYYDSRRSYRGKERSRSGFEEDTSRHDASGKASIAIGLVAAIAGILQLWAGKKKAKLDEETRRRRRENFERAKRDRRRDEERRARQRSWDGERSPTSEVKRIGYMPATSRSRSRSTAPRRLEAPSEASRSSSRHSFDERDKEIRRDRRSRGG